MSVITERATLQVTFPKEKLEALRFYMNEKELTVEGELQKHMTSIYDKYVPVATRRYLDRNDNGQEIQPETTPTTTTSRGRRRTERVQSEQEQVATEAINSEGIEESPEQTEAENQGMVMSM